MVFAQQFNSGIPDSEIECVPFDADEYCPRFGFNMNSICKPEDYGLAPMSAKFVGELAIQNYDKWANINLSQVIPNYVSTFNIGKVKEN